jgi:hypothetical protein
VRLHARFDQAGAEAFDDGSGGRVSSSVDPPMFMARTPMGYHDVGKVRADLAKTLELSTFSHKLALTSTQAAFSSIANNMR